MTAHEAGARVSFHRPGGRAQLGTVTGVAEHTHYGRTVLLIECDDPRGEVEHVSADRIIGAALDEMRRKGPRP